MKKFIEKIKQLGGAVAINDWEVFFGTEKEMIAVAIKKNVKEFAKEWGGELPNENDYYNWGKLNNIISTNYSKNPEGYTHVYTCEDLLCQLDELDQEILHIKEILNTKDIHS